MALTPRNLIEVDDCLLVAWINEGLPDGAIARIDVTAPLRDIVVFGIYKGNVVSRTIPAGTTQTITFAGNSAKAGDVMAVGVGAM